MEGRAERRLLRAALRRASRIFPLSQTDPGAGNTGSDAVVIEKPDTLVGQWA